jgi:Tol biopolymer transport system component/tRNA A-37 threonylcarbamoyl transferase component Bud32
MAIPAGTKLGTYEVTSHIGSGGMGDVYQAHDTKLGRDVAIKVLPEKFARDFERLARFQREAKLLAALNHPNIATIHGLEQSGDTHYLVMELVSGDTLRDRILLDGALPIEEALTIARQIAEALEAAHNSEKAIVHRDLKPANIKVTPEGRVKVLDFGLAKAFTAEPSAEDVGNSPTLSMNATAQGVIMGTAAYMSPEQAKGKPVNKATDIFAFGSVLYEMLTGKQAFTGGDVGDILASVVKTDPDWTQFPADTPPNIRTLLRRCLRKDRNQRLQDAATLRIEIEDALSGALPVNADLPIGAVAPQAISPARRLVIPAMAAALLLALATLAFTYFRGGPPPAAPEMRTEIVTPGATDSTSIALSPDGRQIVFAANSDGALRLWLRRLDTTQPRLLPDTEGASYPFWSPDSRSIAFFAGAKLKTLDTAGGAPQTLADAGNGRGGTWNRDGIILFAPSTSGPIFRIAATGGNPVAVTRVNSLPGSHRFPQFLPDGRSFLFYATSAVPENSGIFLAALDSGEPKRLMGADAAGAYLPVGDRTGWLLFPDEGNLRAQRLDLGRRELVGSPVATADSVSIDITLRSTAVSVSAAGLVAYRSGGIANRQLIWYDRSGKMLGSLGEPDRSGLNGPRLSPDGRRVAVSRNVQANSDLWLMDGTRTTRFTFDPGADRWPVWSPDGSRVAFVSGRAGHTDIYVKPANGSGSEEPLVESADSKIPSDWSPDGRFLAFMVTDPKSLFDLWVLPMGGASSANSKEKAKSLPLIKTPFNDATLIFSPDGRWIAYDSDESGRWEVYIRPFNGTSPQSPGAGQWQVSTSGGEWQHWRADGKELYYISLDGKMMAVPITVNGASIEPGKPEVLFQTMVYGIGDPNSGPQWDLSRDGRFLINTVLDEGIAPITLIQNWNPEVKK